tara:strand:+ start:969 stop:1211 length:243 start_codon:yes stop_codon:yes gene_type:complete
MSDFSSSRGLLRAKKITNPKIIKKGIDFINCIKAFASPIIKIDLPIDVLLILCLKNKINIENKTNINNPIGFCIIIYTIF